MVGVFFLGFGSCLVLICLSLFLVGMYAKRHQEKIARVVIRRTMAGGKRGTNDANHAKTS